MLNTCFITVGPVTWVSTRIRAAWVVHNMPNSSVVQGGVDNIPPAENYIWVKGVDLDVIRRHDARHFWDFCDPVWWWGPQDAREISLEMDGIITTCQAMANEVKQESREAIIIPDRFLISHFDKQREHRIPQRDEPLRFIWYGASQNRFSLLGAIAPLERLEGYVPLTWGAIGAIKLFCTKAIKTPAEAAGVKIFAWEGDPGSVKAWKAAGFNPVVLSSTDVISSLQTGMIECIPNVPLYVLTARLFEKAPYMIPLEPGQPEIKVPEKQNTTGNHTGNESPKKPSQTIPQKYRQYLEYNPCEEG